MQYIFRLFFFLKILGGNDIYGGFMSMRKKTGLPLFQKMEPKELKLIGMDMPMDSFTMRRHSI